jgi:electron transfer flavoprotein alpha/beta subunit
MKIVVCIKQVPDTNEVRIDEKTGTLIRTGIPCIVNPDDLHAVEEALRIKESREDVQVWVISMGPPQAMEAVREAYAMGVDEAILLSDRYFAGSDTWATATILAAAIREIGDVDIVFCGRQAIDGDTAQVGPELAEFLGIPQITYVRSLEVRDDRVIAERAIEDGHFVIESPLPVLLTVIKDLNQPRYPRIPKIYEAFTEEANIAVWDNQRVGADLSQIGVKNSPTNVYKSFVPQKERFSTQITGTVKEMADELITELEKQQLVKRNGSQ